MIAVHGCALPWIVARHTQLPLRQIIGPLVRPLAAATLAAGLALIVCRAPGQASTIDTAKS